MRRGVIGAFALVAACLSDAPYTCEDDLQCIAGDREGICTPDHWCAYAENECISGLVYSRLADPEIAGSCVPSVDATGSTTVPDPTSGADPSSSSTQATCGDDVCAASTQDGTESTGEPDCETTCIAGPHATAACDELGECVRTCEAPWEDCDADPSNGCEVPVGMTAQCSMLGLDPDGCWTPYCGESTATNAVNFGAYHCVWCETCRAPSADHCSWCEQETGLWYPTAADCYCGDFLGDVCVAE